MNIRPRYDNLGPTFDRISVQGHIHYEIHIMCCAYLCMLVTLLSMGRMRSLPIVLDHRVQGRIIVLVLYFQSVFAELECAQSHGMGSSIGKRP